jgi:hypothetical protein
MLFGIIGWILLDRNKRQAIENKKKIKHDTLFILIIWRIHLAL